MNNLTLNIYPMPEVTRITGLDNYKYNLTGQARFDNHLGDLLKAILARPLPPVCLVAHNGQMYDCPLPKAEMQQVIRKFRVLHFLRRFISRNKGDI